MLTWSQFGLQEGASTVMELLIYFHDYMMMLVIMIMVFVSYVMGFVLMSSKIDLNTMDSHLLETIWTVVPMIILIFMAFPSLYLLYLMEETSSSMVTIKVVGHQWYWEYEYANSWFNYSFDSYMVHNLPSSCLFYTLDVDNRLVLPLKVSVLFLVTSADVLHSWTVPSLGIKVDAIPGRLNYLHTFVSNSGVYFGQCSEICGSNHSFMPIVLEFVPASNFLSYISDLNV